MHMGVELPSPLSPPNLTIFDNSGETMYINAFNEFVSRSQV